MVICGHLMFGHFTGDVPLSMSPVASSPSATSLSPVGLKILQGGMVGASFLGSCLQILQQSGKYPSFSQGHTFFIGPYA